MIHHWTRLLYCLFVLTLFLAPVKTLHSQPPLPGHGDDNDQPASGLAAFEITIPDDPVAGESFDIGIQAKDLEGNDDETFSGTVILSTNNTFGAGTVTETGSFIDGFRVHTISLEEAIPTTITVINAEPGEDQSGTSGVFNVLAAGVNSFAIKEYLEEDPGNGVSDEIGTQQAGVPFTLYIEALDEFGNVATGFDGTVLLDVQDNHFEADVEATTDPFTDGVVNHEVSLTDLSDNTTVIAENSDGTEQGISNAFEVEEGLPSEIQILQQPPSFVLAGDVITPSPQIRVTDMFGNTISGQNAGVSLKLNDSDASFAAGVVTQTITDSNGEAIFDDLVIETAGDGYRMIFSVNDHQKESSNFVTVISTGASEMLITQQPQTTVAGTPIEGPPTIQLVDPQDNPVANGQISVELSEPGLLSGTTTLATDTQGNVTFDDLVINQAGTYSLTFSTTASGVDDVISDPFEVEAAPLTHFEITTTDLNPIPDQVSGVDFEVRIIGYDEFDNIATGFDGTVDLSTNNAFGATVISTTGNFTNGVLDTHTLSLCEVSDDYHISAVNSAAGEDQEGTSDAFSVAADHGNLYDFLITDEHADPIPGQVVGTPFDIRIVARDQCTNTVQDFEESVELLTDNAFGLGVATETAHFESGILASQEVYLRNAADQASITASYQGVNSSSDVFDVDPRPITIRVNDASRAYAAPDPVFSFQDFSGELIDGDEMANITGGDGEASDVTFETVITHQYTDIGEYENDIGIVTSSLDGDRAFSYDVTVERGTLTIVQAVPVISQWPVAHLPLNKELGEAEFFDAITDVPGSFAFTNPDLTFEEMGEYSFEAIFTPDDDHNYEEVSGTVSLTVGPAVPLGKLAFLIMTGLMLFFAVITTRKL